MAQVICRFGGAEVRRVVDRAAGHVPEHVHDWPVLSIFVLGGYRNTTELGAVEIAGPSAIFYGPRAAHANSIGHDGFEQIEVEFDPAWVGMGLGAPVSRWTGGPAAVAARALARTCAATPSELEVRLAVRRILAHDADPAGQSPHPWAHRVDAMLRNDPSLTVGELARHVGRHPAWLGAAYAQARGEGLRQAAARLRVERAARRLRETDDAPADIAAVTGFCDQSHMVRVFRRLLGRTPSAVRADRAFMRPSEAAPQGRDLARASA